MKSWAEPGSVALALLLLAGCSSPDGSGGPVPVPTVDGVAWADSFAGLSGPLPPGWEPHGGQWKAAQTADPGHFDVMQGAGASDPGLSSLVATAAGNFSDFEASVAFQMVSGEHPQGAGMVLHFQDVSNYQIIRYSVSENGWHLFVVQDGNRDKKSEASVADPTTHPEFGQWVDLRVSSREGRVEAYDGGVKVIDYGLPSEAAAVGGVGLFSRGDTVAFFDGFSVGPL